MPPPLKMDITNFAFELFNSKAQVFRPRYLQHPNVHFATDHCSTVCIEGYCYTDC
jgi:hypothetical protein